MAFVLQMVKHEGGEVRYVTANENGRGAWYFIKLFPQRYPEYKKALRSGSLVLREYGEILASGWGDKAPNDVLQKMKILHNVKW